MLLGFFTEEAYDRLLDAVDENKDKYLEPDNWVASYFGPGVEWCGTSSQQVNKFTPYCPDVKDKSESDLTNAIKLYEKCGFKLIGERKNFYSKPTEDALIYTYYLEE